MKNKTLVLSVILSVVAVVFAHAQQDFCPESDFQVLRNSGGNSVTVTGYLGSSWEVNIPPRIRQLPVTAIGNSAFAGKSISSVTIPDSVATIEEKAFAYCRSLRNITIPNNITNIGDNAFSGNWSITSLTIGNGVTNIGDYAFSGCLDLSIVTIHAITPPALGENIFADTRPNLQIEVPAASVNAYKAAAGWREFADRIFAIW